MLKKLIFEKSKKVLDEIRSAETIIEESQKKINELKNADRFGMLREEIFRLIRNTNLITHELSQSFNPKFLSDKQQELERDIILIDKCLTEINDLHREKTDEKTTEKA